LQSTNGTYLNRTRLNPRVPYALKIGDTIGLGVSQLEHVNIDVARPHWPRCIYRVMQAHEPLSADHPLFTPSASQGRSSQTSSVRHSRVRRVCMCRRMVRRLVTRRLIQQCNGTAHCQCPVNFLRRVLTEEMDSDVEDHCIAPEEICPSRSSRCCI